MSSQGTNLVTVKSRLVTVLSARPALDGVPVSYGAPQYASDLTASDGQLTAIWLSSPPNSAFAQKTIPYMMGGAKATREDVNFEAVVQSIARGSSATQLHADSNGVAMMIEFESALAADPTIGLTSPNPLALQITGWRQITLEPTASAKGCRFELTVAYEADIDAPS